MKGTLFSADFVKDSNGVLKLLEVNTDTAISSGGLQHADYTELFNLLSSLDIDTIVVIHKRFQDNFVNHFSDKVTELAPFITTFETIVEERSTIYPTQVVDAPNKFILRCAYDESAIFDSTYCANAFNTLNLFKENNDTSNIPNFYYKSSEDSIEVDTLQSVQNNTNRPDVAIKNVSNVHSKIKFVKVGGLGSVEENFNTLKTESLDKQLILNYYDDETSIKSVSLRSLNIIYSNDGLNILNFCNFEGDSIFEKPTTIDYDTSVVKNIVDDKHYFEFSTNIPKTNSLINAGGIFEDEKITNANGEGVIVTDLVNGESYKSFYVEGSPDSDLPEVFTTWSYPGSQLPEGSYETTSTLINTITQPLDRKMINNVIVSDNGTTASFRVSSNQHLLVYNSVNDVLSYKMVQGLTIGEDNLIKLNGDLIPITSNETEILEGDHSTVLIDMETSDTFLLHDTGLNIKIVTHNCFPKGTKILLSDGTNKNIEDLSLEDELLTFNQNTKKHGSGKIGSIQVTTQNRLISIVSETDSIRSTPSHRFYTKDRGWVTADDLTIEDHLLNSDGKFVRINSIEKLEGEFEVYHIIDVKEDHTYYAENLLVHNIKLKPVIDPTCFSAGTRITLSDYSEKFIEDVEVGDEVLGWDGEKLVPAKVLRLDNDHTVSAHASACEKLGDEPSLYTINDTGIEFTPEHPFLTQEGWKSLVPDPNQEPYKTEQEPKELKVGDSILRNGVWEEITEIRVVRSNPDEPVYNLVIDGVHSYVADGIIVHNKL